MFRSLIRAFREVLHALASSDAALQRSTLPWRFVCSGAEERGQQLLLSILSRAQWEQYRRDGFFDVAGGETGRRYRIYWGYQMNVEEFDRNGRPVRSLCFAPEGSLPVADVMLAQKMALELFEVEGAFRLCASFC